MLIACELYVPCRLNTFSLLSTVVSKYIQILNATGKMPLVGLGGYLLSRHNPHLPTAPEVTGEFIKIKISTSCDRITGRLFLNFGTHRCCYDGIKVRLDLHLKPIATERVNATCSEMDLFEHYPIETTFPSKLILSVGTIFCNKFMSILLNLKAVCLLDRNG